MPLTTPDWNYHERQDKHGRGVITLWQTSLGKKAQANLERTLDQLKRMPKQAWSKPAPASNIGDHTYVIRFKDVTGLPLRVFGHFFDPHASFVMTFDGYEKDNVYYPSGYEALAQRHRVACDQAFFDSTIRYKHHCSICTEHAGPPSKQRH